MRTRLICKRFYLEYVPGKRRTEVCSPSIPQCARKAPFSSFYIICTAPL